MINFHAVTKIDLEWKAKDIFLMVLKNQEIHIQILTYLYVYL